MRAGIVSLVRNASQARWLRIGGALDRSQSQCHIHNMQQDALENLRDILRSCGSCVVAYSGGVDSTFLAYVAHQVLGDRALAVIADTPSLPRRELEEALDVAHRFGFPTRVIRTGEFALNSYTANSDDRCYHCKHELFAVLCSIAREGSYATVLYGENASDTHDHRPGGRAAIEFGARAPLKEAGLTKADIRALSAQLGLPTADKPQMACLSSRVPYGEKLAVRKLAMIEQAEYVLRDLGFRNVRVRHHELPRLPGAPERQLARIELGAEEIPLLIRDNNRTRVAETLRQIGYQHVTLDLQGYRRGSANEVFQTGRTESE